jgi:hypothetical protein
MALHLENEMFFLAESRRQKISVSTTANGNNKRCSFD